MKPVKLGIIGCGIAAKKLHYPALSHLRDKFEIVCVCNRSEPKAEEFSKMVGSVPYVLDYRQLLKDKEVEAVSLILPIPLNYSVTQDALKAGKHVIVEKPLAGNLDDAKAMLQFPAAYSTIMMVAENFRYYPVLQRVKELMDDGTIGKPYSVFWDNFMYIDCDSNPYAKTLWRLNQEYIGGYVLDGGVHNIAGLRYLFGDFDYYKAFTLSTNPILGTVDSLCMHFSTKKGMVGVFNDYFNAKGFAERRLVLLGTEGSLVVQDNTIELKRLEHEKHTIKVEGDSGYIGQYEDFYAAIMGNKPPTSSFQEAYRDLEIIITALEQAQQSGRYRKVTT